jgi:hypothetical protein
MRYGRTLLAGLGWAGTLGGLALCVLLFLSAYLAFDDPPAVKPREDSVIRLPSVPEAEAPRVPLARPSRRAPTGDGGGGGAGAPARATTPRPRATPRATAPVQTTPQAPLGGDPPPPPTEVATPAPAAVNPPAGSAAPLSPPPAPPTLGDTTRGVVGAVGTGVGRVSPPAGQVIEDTGDTLGDAVDTLTAPRR